LGTPETDEQVRESGARSSLSLGRLPSPTPLTVAVQAKHAAGTPHTNLHRSSVPLQRAWRLEAVFVRSPEDSDRSVDHVTVVYFGAAEKKNFSSAEISCIGCDMIAHIINMLYKMSESLSRDSGR
jgi:hypothetical protein